MVDRSTYRPIFLLHREHQSRSRDDTALKSACRAGVSGVPQVQYVHAVWSAPTRTACSFMEIKCWTTCQSAERSGSGSIERFRFRFRVSRWEGTSPSRCSALGTKTASVTGRSGVGAPHDDDGGVGVEAVPSFSISSLGTFKVLDSGSWLLVPWSCWAGLEPSVGRTLRASRLCLRLRGTFTRRGESPDGLKGVDSSPSWAGAHPSRKAPKMTCRVSSSVTPENESYFSGSIDPGAQWPRVPSPRVSTKPCLRS
jgi:hypothetical protein